MYSCLAVLSSLVADVFNSFDFISFAIYSSRSLFRYLVSSLVTPFLPSFFMCYVFSSLVQSFVLSLVIYGLRSVVVHFCLMYVFRLLFRQLCPSSFS